MLENTIKFIKIARLARRIQDSGADWQDIFDVIFSSDIGDALDATGIEFSYDDPDTSYEEDVRAYVTAANNKADRLERVLVACGIDLDERQEHS